MVYGLSALGVPPYGTLLPSVVPSVGVIIFRRRIEENNKMPNALLRKYGVESTINFELFEVDGIDFRIDAVHAAGDSVIMKDEGAEASTTNGFTDEGKGYSLTLTVTEMQAARIVIYLADLTATKVWLDRSIVIETYGHASAMHAMDFDDTVRGGLTSLPNAAADAAGGLPISDAGGLDLDTKLANTNEITAVRMATLTDWINGGRLDLLLDAIPTTAMRGTDSAATETKQDIIDTVVDAIRAVTDLLPDAGALTAIGTDTARLTAVRAAVLTDWINGGRLDLLLDAIPITAMRGTDGANTVVPDAAGVVPTAAEIDTELQGTHGVGAWTTGAGGSDRLLMIDTTIATLASQTSFTLTAGSTDNDAYNNCTIVIEDASTSTQKAVGIVSAYVGATKTITLKYDPTIFTMAATDKVYILAENALKASGANRQLSVESDGDLTKVNLCANTTLVGTVTTNTDMRGTDGANTTVPDVAGTAPTAVENRQEMDSNSTRLSIIAIDAARLTAARAGALTDWIDGGRLDLLLDAIKAITDLLTLAAINAEVDTALDTVIPVSPTSGSINDVLDIQKDAIIGGLAQTGTLSTTVMTTDLAEITDDHYNGRVVVFRGGVLDGQATDITDYSGTNGTITMTAITEAPLNNQSFTIV